jgi:hypothetical protein
MKLCWIVVLCLFAGTPANAADMPGPWVEFASDGGLDIRAVTAPGMPCPKVVAERTTLASQTRGVPDAVGGAYPVQVCVAHSKDMPRDATW